MVRQYSRNKPITKSWLCQAVEWPQPLPKTIMDLVNLEAVFDILELYLWLRYDFRILMLNVINAKVCFFLLFTEQRIDRDVLLNYFLSGFSFIGIADTNNCLPVRSRGVFLVHK